MHDLRLVVTTFPSIDAARQIGTLLVEKQLAACVNFIAGVESIYRWQGQIESAQETLAIFKSHASVQQSFEQALIAHHPYEVPEILWITPSSASPAILAWLNANIRLTD